MTWTPCSPECHTGNGHTYGDDCDKELGRRVSTLEEMQRGDTIEVGSRQQFTTEMLDNARADIRKVSRWEQWHKIDLKIHEAGLVEMDTEVDEFDPFPDPDHSLHGKYLVVEVVSIARKP